MRVLQISPVAPPQRSGMANAAGEIYKMTKSAVELSLTDGVEVDLVAAFGESTIGGLKHWRVPGAGFLSFTPALVSLSKKYDVMHLHYPCYGNALMVSLARMLGNKQPLVVSYHMDTVGRGLRRPIFWLHAKFLAPRFLRQAAVIVVASRDYAAHSLLAAYPELMAKVVEIPFGVDAARFHPAAGKDMAAKKILFAAALDEQHYFKGLDVLLQAMVAVPGAQLTVVGDGNLKGKYVKKAEELKIGERVHFAGRVSDEDLPKYYQDADLFCSASLDRSEAYGIVLMEAAASGLPAVATAIPGVRTVVEDGETGLLVPPNDAGALAEALRDLLNDPELLKKMGESARKFALTRTWKSAGDKYLEIYNKVLSNPSP